MKKSPLSSWLLALLLFASSLAQAQLTLQDRDPQLPAEAPQPKMATQMSALSVSALASPALTADSLALVDLYNATNGPQWTRKTNWLTGRLSTWQGITVSANRVTRVQLNGNNMVGTIPASIGNLTALNWLHLYLNNLTGGIPSSMGNLTALTQLMLYDNPLGGSIPSSIGNLVNLTHLYIYRNNMTGDIPASLGNLNKVQILALHQNNLTGNLDWVGGLSAMLQLWIYNNPTLQCSIPSALGNLTQLQQCYLYGNNHMGQLPATLGNLVNLTHFWIHFNPAITGSVPAYISNWTKMQVLSIGDTGLTGPLPSNIGNMTGLLQLYIQNSAIDGNLPADLSRAINLNYADIKGMHLASLPSVLTGFTKMVSVVANNNDLTSILSFTTHVNKANLIYNVENNKLDFEDLEPHFTGAGTHVYKTFTYAPQADLGTPQTVSWNFGAAHSLQVQTPGTYNVYQWQKLNAGTWQDLSGENTSQLQRAVVAASDSGRYRLKITNQRATALTLYSSPFKVKVISQGVAWTDFVNMQVNADNSLSKVTPAADWNSGAASYNVLEAGKDGWMEFVLNEPMSRFMVGLSRGNVDMGYTQIAYAIYVLGNGDIRIFESGTLVGSVATANAGDVYRIRREGNSVIYTRNGTVLRSVTTSPADALLIDATLYSGTVPAITSSISSLHVENVMVRPENGSISLTAAGGAQPYSYSWSSGEATPSVTGKPAGTYTVTVTDALGATRTFQYRLGQPLAWTDLINVTVNADNSVTKAGTASNWDAGAASHNMLEAGKDGWVEFVMGEPGNPWMVGLSNANIDLNLTKVQYALYFTSAKAVVIYENGVSRGQFAIARKDDVFRISRQGDNISYTNNGRIMRTVTGSSAESLLIDMEVYAGSIPVMSSSFGSLHVDATSVHAVSPGASDGAIAAVVAGGVPPYTYAWTSGETTPSISGKSIGTYSLTVTDALGEERTKTYSLGHKIAWTDLFDVTVNADNSLSEVEGAGWNSGAGSYNMLNTSEDGWVEFVMNDAGTPFIVGLSRINTSLSLVTVGYGLYMTSTGAVLIYEGGTSRGQFASARRGDVFRISREGTNINYYQNGRLMRTVAGTSEPLLIDVSLDSGYVPVVNSSFGSLHIEATIAPPASGAANGSIATTALGGVSPHTYSWTSGENTPALTGKASGTYSLTVTDASGATKTRDYHFGHRVSWATLQNMVQNADQSLIKNGGVSSNWDAGSISYNKLAAGQDGWVEFVVQDVGNYFMLGLSGTNTGVGYATMRYALNITSSGAFLAYEDGRNEGQLGYLRKGDVLRMAREGTSLKYYVNGLLLRTVTTDPNVDYWIKTTQYIGGSPAMTSSFAAPAAILNTVVTGTGRADGTGSIAITTEGGAAPYTYQWSGGEQVGTISNKARGTYTVTITGAGGQPLTRTYRIGYKTAYIFHTQVTEANGVLSKTTAAGWNAGANTANFLAPNTDGWMEFVAGSASGYAIGFGSNFGRFLQTDFNNAFVINSVGQVFSYEGSTSTQLGTWTAGDVFRIAREGSSIKYYQNGTLLRTVTTDASLEQWVKTALYTGSTPSVTASFDSRLILNASVMGTGITDGSGSIALQVTGGTAPYTYSWSGGEQTSAISNKQRGNYTVTVTDAEGRTQNKTFSLGYKLYYADLKQTTDTNGVLTKSAVAGWNAGANSGNILPANTDGWIEFVAGSISAYEIGFGNNLDGLWYTHFRNGFLLNLLHQVSYYEGSTGVAITTWLPGDVFRVAREGSSIKYYKNGTLLRTVAANPNLDLYVKTLLYSGDTPTVTASFDSKLITTASVTGTARADGTGSIALETTGGTAPYTYQWSGGEQADSIGNKSRGAYTVTITDAEGRTSNRRYNIGYKVDHEEHQQATETAKGTLTKTVAAGWNAGANGTNTIPANTDGWVEFVVGRGNVYEIGFGLTLGGFAVGDFRSALVIDETTHLVTSYEGGTNTSLGSALPGDVFRISREGTAMKYYRNETVLRTLTIDPKVELWVKTLLNNGETPVTTVSSDASVLVNAIVTGTGITDGTGSIVADAKGGTAPYTYSWSGGEQSGTITGKSRGTYTLTVTDAEGRTRTRTYGIGYKINYIGHSQVTDVNGDGVLTKSIAAGWNAGANGANILPANTDGWVEFVAGRGSMYEIGFGSHTAAFGYENFRQGLAIYSTNSLVYYYEGTSGTYLGAWEQGDVFRIAREGPNVNYYRNGSLLRTVTVDPKIELWVKTALYGGSTPRVTTSFDSKLIVNAVVRNTGRADGTGSIALDVTGGTAPYTYSWSGGEQADSVGNKSRGAYSVTVTDADGRTLSRTYNVGYKLHHSDHLQVTETNGVLNKTGAAGWNAGANSFNVLPANTDGWLEFVASAATTYEVGFGMSIGTNVAGSFNYSDFRNAFGIYHATSLVYYYEQTAGTYLSSWQPGDVFRIVREGSNIKYYQNGTLLRTIATDPKLELQVKTTLHSGAGTPLIATSFDEQTVVNAEVRSIASTGGTGSIVLTTTGGTSPYAYVWSGGEQTASVAGKAMGAYTATVTDADNRVQSRTYGIGYNAVWTDQLGVTENDNILTKTTAIGWGNAGASSSNTLQANTDGWIEFVAPAGPASYIVEIGFTVVGNVSAFSVGSFTNGLRLDQASRNLYIYEGSPSIVLGSYQPGDVFRISREGSNVKYYRNGTVVRTVAVNANQVLKAKAALYAGSTPRVSTSFWVAPNEGNTPDMTEFMVLKQLYDSLAGSGWTNKTNWPTTWPASATSAEFGTWFGVTVVNGDIADITLPANNLTGKVPASVGNLASLTALRLSNNHINGRIPASIGNLAKVTMLTLNDNLLTGAIPTSIGGMTQLVTLYLNGNDLSGAIPTTIGSLANLEHLYLFGNELSGSIPSQIASLVKLKQLQLQDNNLTGNIPAFGSMPALTLLYLEDNQLTGNIPASLGGLTSLQYLNLSNNKISGNVPVQLGQLSNLEDLRIASTDITGIPSELGQLTKLKVLKLNDNKITGTIPPSLGNLHEVITFTLNGNQFTGSIPSSLGALNKAVYFYLNNNKLTGPIPAELNGLTSVLYLYLSNNELSGSIPASLGSLTSLRHLLLETNKLTGSIPASLGSLNNLEQLFLNSNELTGQVPGSFTNLANVTALILAHNKLSGALPSLNGMAKLTSLSVYNNEITAIPDFTAFANKANLALDIRNNRIDFGSVEPNFTAPGVSVFQSLLFAEQKLFNEVTEALIPEGHLLKIDARNPGQYGTVTWEYRANASLPWTSFNTQNEDATQRSLQLSDFNDSKAGYYRYTLTNTRVTGVTLRSVEINVRVGGHLAEWVKLKNVTNNGGVLTKTAPDGWANAGADASNLLHAREDGWIEFVSEAATSAYVIGLSTEDRIVHPVNGYAFNINNNDFYIGENTSFTHMGTRQPGDIFRIARIGNKVRFYRNGIVLRTVTTDSLLTLRIKAVLYAGNSPKVISSFDVNPLLQPTLIPVPASGTGGAITVAALYGKTPYTYTWSDGANSASISGKPVGTYTATVTDSLGRVAAVPYDLGYAIRWTDVKNVVVENGGLKKTTPDGWSNAGANSVNLLQGSQDGWVSFIADTTSGAYIIGFATDDRSFNYQQVANGVYVNSDNLVYIMESGGSSILVGSKTEGDVFRIARAGNQITYYRNGQVLRTVTVDSVVMLRVKAVMRGGRSPRAFASFDLKPELHASITPVNVGGTAGAITITASNGDAPYSYQWSTGATGATLSNQPVGTYTTTVTDGAGRVISRPYDVGYRVRWADRKNANEVNNGLTKTTTDGWNNGGGIASNYLRSNEDGWLSFIADTTSSAYVLGFATDDRRFSYQDLTHGIYVNIDNRVYIMEAGTSTLVGAKATGDVFRITRIGNQVTYYRNGEVLKTSPTLPALNLGIKTSLYKGHSPAVLASFDAKPWIAAAITPVNVSGTGGAITLTASAGDAPYTFQWSTGTAGAALSNQPVGTYTATITDGAGRVISRPYDLGYRVRWAKLKNTSEVAGALVKTAGDGWDNGGAVSASRLQGGEDGWISFIADTTSSAYVLGWATEDHHFSYQQLLYGIYVSIDNQLYIMESGTSMLVGAKIPGDVFRIVRTGNQVVYYRNGAVIKTSVAEPLLTLSVKSSLYKGKSPAVLASFDVKPLLAAGITPLGSAGTGGAATVTGLYGDSPYAYQWAAGVTGPTLANQLMGTYPVTATDASGRTVSRPYDIGYSVGWKNHTNVNEIGGGLVKTNADNWDAGANSSNLLNGNENGWLSFIADTTRSYYAMGFATDTANFSYLHFTHGIYVTYDNMVYLLEAGATTLIGSRIPGDVYRIVRTGNQMSFYRNGMSLKTVAVDPSLTLRVKSAIFTGRTPRVFASFEGSSSQMSGNKVQWIDLSGVSDANGILTKQGSAGWTDGANSANLLRANEDGWFQYVTFSNTSRYLIGFTTYSGPYSESTVNYGLEVVPGDSLSLWENNSQGIALMPWAIGDTLKIERAGTQITYYKNGQPIRTVATDAATELRVRAVVHTGNSPAVFASFHPYLLVTASTITPVKANGTGGGVAVLPMHGKSPYTYAWSSGETTPGISNKSTGVYSVTVNDSKGLTRTVPYTLGYRASWTDVTNASNNNGALTRTAGEAWNGGANGYNVLHEGENGWIEFVLGTVPGNYIIGFSSGGVGFEQERMDHGLAVLAGQKIAAYEKSTIGVPLSSWQPGDVLKISRTGNTVKYYRNGVELRSVATDGSKALRVKALVYSGTAPSTTVSFDVPLILQANFTPLKSYGLAGGISIVPVTGTPPFTYSWSSGENAQTITNKGLGTYSVTVTDADARTITRPYALGYKTLWTDLVNAAENGFVLSKTTTDGSIAGANSVNVLKPNEDGWVQFTVDNSISHVSIGFATYSGVFNTAAIDHSLTVKPGEPVIATESNWTGFSMGSWEIGDVYKIARVGNQVTYYRNGTAMHTVATDPSKEMIVKTAIYGGRISLVQTSIPSNERTVTPIDETTVTYKIPKGVKITRDGRLPVAAAGPPDLYLSEVTAGETRPVFPGCPSGNYYVGFQLLYDLGNRNTTEDWSALVQITMFHNEDSLWTRPLRLKMVDQTFIATAFYDTTISCDGNYFYHIDFKNLEGNVPDDNIYLKTLLYRGDTDLFEVNGSMTVYCPPAGRDKEIRWDHSGRGTVEYDLEWVFIEAHEAFTEQSGQQDAPFKFMEPVRITTPFRKYVHQAYYPDGKIYYRVRAVGYNPQYPDHRIPGKWFYPSCVSSPIDNHQPDMNWQEQTIFAEEGKNKKVINYYDGSLRQRQALTNLSTEKVTLVSETMYDFEGRNSIYVLPVPATDNSLVYKPGFNVFAATDPVVGANTSKYRQKFHYDNYKLEDSPMADTTGAGEFYSPNNASDDLHRDYIADAKGYVYSQTEYLNDGTQRVARQSTVGEKLRLEGGHATRYGYAEAAPEEIIRLFGNNVGKAEHYKKNAIVDANGQVKISYLDQEDRVVATALAGESPDNLESLKSYKDLDTTSVVVNLAGKNKTGDGVSTISHRIMNVKQNTRHTFAYELSAFGSDTTGFGCKSCTFELKISLTDPDGKQIDLSDFAGSDPSNTTKDYVRRNIVADKCDTATVVNDVRFALVFADIGDYTITKTLSAYDRSFEEMNTLLRQNETVIEKIEEVENSVVIDEGNCEICTQACPEAEQVINEAIEEIAEQDCENIYRQIENELQQDYEDWFVQTYPDSTSEEIYVVPDSLIRKHAMYCQYELCVKDKPSAIFEKQIVRAANWDAADSLGYADLLAVDPFFNDPNLSGYGDPKNDMQELLDNIYVANIRGHTYSGPLGDVTDPANTDYYVDENGFQDSDGRHVLYLDLMGKKEQGMISESVYQAEISHARWALYRGFYTEAKRQLKLTLTAYLECDSAKKELEQVADMPSTEEEMPEWGDKHYAVIGDEATPDQIETSIISLKMGCKAEFTQADTALLKAHLKLYFKSSKKNFFRLILKRDRLSNNPHLNAIQSVLNKYGCNIDDLALDDPMECAKDTLIYVPEPIIDDGENTFTLTSAMSSDDQGAPFFSEQTVVMQPEDDTVSVGQEAPKAEARAAASLMSTLAVPTVPPTQDEYNALLAFYASTQGSQWSADYGWEDGVNDPDKTTRFVHTWYGVTVDVATGHITKIRLPDNRLNGPIPPELNKLTELDELDLSNCHHSYCNSYSYNRITGFPAVLDKLTKLKKLDLYSSGVLGATEGALQYITDAISKSKDLDYLDLTGCGVRGPFTRDIGNFNKLTHLWLASNPLISDTIPHSIGKLVLLNDLNLGSCQLVNPIPDSLWTIHTMEYLSLNNNKLRDSIPRDVGKLTNLRSLNLSSNPFNDSIPYVIGTKLRKLQSLYISSAQLQNPIPESLWTLPALQTLYLNNNNLKDTIPHSIGKLKSIWNLNLSSNPFNDTIPMTIGRLKTLRNLYMSNCKLVKPLPDSLWRLDLLSTLSLSNNPFVNDTIPSAIKGLKNLYELDLSGDSIMGPIPKSIGEIRYLSRLFLSGNKLTVIPESMGKLKSLTYLYLQNNRFTDIPDSLGYATSLNTLYLSDNRLTDSIPETFGNLRSLQYFYIQNNKTLGGRLPQSLGKMTSLQYFYFYTNKIKGAIPESFGKLGALQYFIGYDNLLNKLPDSLGYVSPSLTQFDLHHNKLKGRVPASWNRIRFGSIRLDDNQLSGHIPHHVGQYTPNVYFANNKFTFSDLIDIKRSYDSLEWSSQLSYVPQDTVDVPKSLSAKVTQSLTLIADVDRNTNPPSTFQWYKSVNGGYNGAVAVGTPGPVVTINNIAETDDGNVYFYRITNPSGAPGLTLYSDFQTLTVIKPKTISLCTEFDQNNKTIDLFTFKVSWDSVMANCIRNARLEQEILQQYAVEKLIEEEMSTFYNKFRTNCFERATESLKYSYRDIAHHYTLYYFDQADNLVQTVPPQGVRLLDDPQVQLVMRGGTVNHAHALVTRYRYNTQNQIVWRHTPDAGESEFWYNKKGQLRLSQDARQRGGSSYLYTRYDEQGRIIETGEVNAPVDAETLTDSLESLSFPRRQDYALADVTSTLYDFADPAAAEAGFAQMSLRSRVSRVAVVAKDAADTVTTHYSYDNHGNVKSLLQQLPGLGSKRTDYVYDLVSNKMNYVMYQYDRADEFIHRYDYDADNRVREVQTSSDGFIWDRDARYTYYHHGPLARQDVGEYHLQGADYYYTLQGWIKGVNGIGFDPGQDGTAPSPADVFGYNVGYYAGDYTAVGLGAASEVFQKPMQAYASLMGNQGLYNGNIIWMATDLKKIGEIKGNSNLGRQAMLYRFDQLHRIIRSRSLLPDEDTGEFVSRTSALQAYDEDFSYDANGNLLTLQRYDQHAVLKDNFEYSYYRNTNRLRQLIPVTRDTIYEGGAITSNHKVYRKIVIRGNAYVVAGSDVVLKATDSIMVHNDFDVADDANFQAYVLPEEEGVFLYDATGNLIWDQEQGVKISWTPNGKVREVVKGDTTIVRFRYDGAGNRVEKQIIRPGKTTTTRYVYDGTGQIMAVYQDSVLIEQSIYGSSRLGVYYGGRVAGHRTLGSRNYEFSNHLGNVLSVISDNIYMDADSAWTKIISANDYYPFGLAMQGRTYSDTTYRYGFNGMEKDNNGEFGSDTYATHFRQYDPRIGRWFSIDPKTAAQPWQSPYAAFDNSPIWRNDPKGDIAPIVIWALKKLGEAAVYVMTDVAIQAAIEHFIGGKDWDQIEIDWYQALGSGSEAIIPGKKAKIAFSAGWDMLSYTFQAEDWNVEEFVMAGIKGGISEILGDKAGDLIKKYGSAVVTKGLLKLGLDRKNIRSLLGSFELPAHLKDRVKLRVSTKNAVYAKTKVMKIEGKLRWIGPDGKAISGNKKTWDPTRKQYVYGDFDFSHKQGHKWSDYQDDPRNWDKTRQQVLDDQNNPDIYVIESQSSNRSAGALGIY